MLGATPDHLLSIVREVAARFGPEVASRGATIIIDGAPSICRVKRAELVRAYTASTMEDLEPLGVIRVYRWTIVILASR